MRAAGVAAAGLRLVGALVERALLAHRGGGRASAIVHRAIRVRPHQWVGRGSPLDRSQGDGCNRRVLVGRAAEGSVVRRGDLSLEPDVQVEVDAPRPDSVPGRTQVARQLGPSSGTQLADDAHRDLGLRAARCCSPWHSVLDQRERPEKCWPEGRTRGLVRRERAVSAQVVDVKSEGFGCLQVLLSSPAKRNNIFRFVLSQYFLERQRWHRRRRSASPRSARCTG